MKTLNRYTPITIVAIVLLSTACVQANLAQMTWDGMAQYRKVDLHSPVRNANTKAGLMNIGYLGESRLAFCGQLDEYADDGLVLKQWPLLDLPNGSSLAYLMNTWYDPAASQDYAAALQLALWEVMYETSGTWNLSNGALWVEQNSLASLADSMLGGIPLGGATHTNAVLLEVDGAQDMITVIPEPATMGLLAVGGGAILIRRRNRRRHA